MSASGDEKKSIDIKIALAAVAQQKQEIAKQQSQTAAGKGTEIGQTKTNVYESMAALQKFQKDSVRVKVSEAENRKIIQQNKIKEVQQQFNEVTANKDKYDSSSYNAYAQNVGSYLKNADENIEVLNQAIASGTAAKIIYNKNIKALEKEALKPQLKKEIKYKTSPPMKEKLPPGATQGPPKTLYSTRVSKQVQFITEFIGADIKNDKQREKAIKEFSPLYAQTVGTSEDAGEKLVREVDLKIRNYEKMADYATPLGIDELTGPDRKANMNKLKARFAHMTLATDKAFIVSVPIIALGAVGGPITTGLIAAAGVASLANPANVAELDKYVQAHPQTFLASLGGALLAGVTVSEVSKAFKLHTKNMKLAERRKLETQYDKMIDDYAYLEQKKGAEFPTKAIEIPEAFQGQIKGEIIISNPVNPTQEMMARVIRNSIAEYGSKEFTDFFNDPKSKLSFYMDSGQGIMDPMTVPEMLNKYPGLKEPWYNPAFADPNILNKANIVARSNNPNINYSPLLAAALVQISKQGYITEEQVKELILINQKNLSLLKQQGIQIPQDFSESKLNDLSLPDIAALIDFPTAEINAQTQETIQDIIQLPQDTPYPPPPLTPEIIEPSKITPILGLGPAEIKKRKEMNLQLFHGAKAKYRVSYPDLKQVIGPLEARSLSDALGKAQRQRKMGKRLPRTIIVELVG